MITRAMSLCLDLPDDDYDWMQFSGAWARERHPVNRRLVPGIQSVGSIRGNSSHMQNPFVILKRPYTTESTGEAIGFSLLYSGSFLAQAEVDPWGVTRILMGIHPLNFNWKLEKEETLQLPEVVMVYSDNGLNDLSHTFHNLFRRRLARGYWRDRPRPILLNSWECMKFDITQEKITRLTNLAKESGIELIVLDDGWFADRVSDQKGLGDWGKDRDVFPGGIRALAKMIRDAGLAFGLWIEPEMVNRDSDLFQDHPDWILRDPNRRLTHGRNEFVLDLSRKEVVDYLFQTLSDRFREADVMYVKWDMNRSMTEAYSISLPPDRQGEVMHRYLMGVYALYERLLSAFPKVLFESCASGGGRFDAGMLFYAPQCWISDDSDAIERIAIQYGSSYGYPLSTFGAHISASPNEQVYRCTPLHTRGNVALFGCFGYELDLGTLSEEELLQIREQVVLAKTCRDVVQNGSFYRLISPFDNRNLAAWMVVNQKQDMALVGWYKILNEVNGPYHRIQLQGLKEDAGYQIWQTDERSRLVPYCAYRASAGILQTEYPQIYSGAELMRIGLVTTDSAAGEWRDGLKKTGDFDSRVYVLYEVTGFTYKKHKP